MSITITISNNREYCEQNYPERVIEEVFPEENGYPEMRFKKYPFELNMSNCNFFDIFRGLGLELDYCGEIAPETVLNLMKSVKPSNMVRPELVEGNMIDLGRDIDYVSRRLFEIKGLAVEARKRGELIIWR